MRILDLCLFRGIVEERKNENYTSVLANLMTWHSRVRKGISSAQSRTLRQQWRAQEAVNGKTH